MQTIQGNKISSLEKGSQVFYYIELI